MSQWMLVGLEWMLGGHNEALTIIKVRADGGWTSGISEDGVNRANHRSQRREFSDAFAVGGVGKEVSALTRKLYS